MENQSLDSINRFVTGLIRRSPHTRLITLYRKTRTDERLSHIGDYPLIAFLIMRLNNFGRRTVSRWECIKTLNNSKEFANFKKREKTELLDNLAGLQKLSTAQIKSPDFKQQLLEKLLNE